MTAPTTPRGYVDPYALDNSAYRSLYADILEHVPDLVFPGSMYVYARMRRDPKLAAILNGWMLQLRRAQWQLDPAGCRPDVVQLCADATGLQVAGDDSVSAARLRGVSWNDHLAAALRCLPFGFSAFEMQAEILDGKARLVGLWERPPWTISRLHTDAKTGLLQGATQDVLWKGDSPQMPADRLVWYAHEREGSNWAGTSLLRSCYASWLIKEEMRRTHAIANRRWGAGVPVMEALPGTTPTSAQMTEAMQMAAAARAGDQAGAATPPGFTMKIVGLSGSVPDTLAFMKWLDLQMASSALMGVLDLGETPNGSRALGDTFMDSFLLALESCGEAVADAATRQINARIVGWNYGADEPVPRVVVSGIGSRREVTAESLQLLLASGALAPSPELTEWVCREYRLPRSDSSVIVPGVDVKPGTDDVQAAAGQPVEPDYEQLADQHSQATAEMTEQWAQQAHPLIDALVAATAAELAAGTLVGLGMLTVKPAVVSALAGGVAAGMLALAAASATVLAGDVAAAGTTVAASLPNASREVIRQQAEATAGVIANGYASAAGREALRLSGTDTNPDDVAAAVRAVLADITTVKDSGLVAGAMAAAASTAQMEGRRAVLNRLPAGTRFQASERLDGNRCEPCRKVNGRVYASLDASLVDYPVLGYRSCEGRSRCRGTLIPILPAS